MLVSGKLVVQYKDSTYLFNFSVNLKVFQNK